MRLILALILAGIYVIGPGAATAQQKTTVSHALSLIGKPKYDADFSHLDYTDPNAPKGGTVNLSAIGGFDSLNPYIVKGRSAVGIGLTFSSLMDQPSDDPSAEYGMVAESVEVPEDISWATFTLRADARFHDGSPITADDVIFSLEMVKAKGIPLFRYYYANVAKGEKLSARKVKFHFTGPRNRELPQIVGQLLPMLSKRYFEAHDFEKTTLSPILGSGPYRVVDVDANRSITYERVKDWWAKDLPINKGRYNFDRLRYDYYRDNTVSQQAFKAHKYDYRAENSAKAWATEYDFPGAKKGLVLREEIPHQRPTGMQGFVFNLRRAKFQDVALRKAMDYAFDFEWTNRHLYYGQYARTESYFDNSVMAARGKPSPEELAILEPYRDKLPPAVFGETYHAPKSDGSGTNRANLRSALKILKQAGWVFRDRQLIDPVSDTPLELEILLVNPRSEGVVSAFAKNLKRLGITARLRLVDSAQYADRLRNYDFDMTISAFGQSASPGNEQREFWGTAAGKRPGSRNLMGIEDPVIDALIETLIAAPDYETLIPAVRALDRVLLHGHYLIPQIHAKFDRLAYWNRFGRAPVNPSNSPDFFSWWIDPDKDAALKKAEAGKGQ